MFKQREQIQKMVLSALLLAIGLILPFLTGQIPEIGSALLPMHIPVLICGFFVWLAMGIGNRFYHATIKIFTVCPAANLSNRSSNGI